MAPLGFNLMNSVFILAICRSSMTALKKGDSSFLDTYAFSKVFLTEE